MSEVQKMPKHRQQQFWRQSSDSTDVEKKIRLHRFLSFEKERKVWISNLTTPTRPPLPSRVPVSGLVRAYVVPLQVFQHLRKDASFFKLLLLYQIKP